MSWLLESFVKITMKVVTNAVAPGWGSVVDFGEAAVDFSNGNYVGGAVNTAFGALDLYTFGVARTAMDAAKEAAKDSAVTAVKQTAKCATQEIGEEAGKQIARGLPKEAVVELAKQSARSAEKKIGQTFAKELSKGMVENAVEEAFKKPLGKELAEGIVFAAVGCGGKNVGKEVFENVAPPVLSHFVKKATEETAKTTFESITADVAKETAKQSAEAFQFRFFYPCYMIANTGKGYYNFYYNDKN